MLRATGLADTGPVPYDIVVLTHDERHLRRRTLVLQHADEVLVDLPAAVRVQHGQRFVLEDGRHVEVIAAEEPLYEVTASDAAALARVAWHLGNRHARTEVDGACLRIARDHVLKDMLIGLGAEVSDVHLPFQPDGPMLHGIPHTHAHD